jgi:uroporphyrinogen decarboxylase
MNWNEIPPARGEANFDNLLAVLRRQVPERPTLFEFFLNERLYTRLAPQLADASNPQARIAAIICAFRRAGYDYANVPVPNFSFTAAHVQRRRERSVSMNEGSVLHTRADFAAFPWPDPDQADYDVLDRLAPETPPGMKLIVYGPGGVLENVVELVGYEAACLMIHDDPPLALEIFGAVGARLVRYYERVAGYPMVGACISNDDWGHKTQTMFSPRDMRKFVFPWHKRIVETIHAAGKPAILHSCGHFQRVIDDVIDDMRYDARHSYEDSILPVETFYEQYHRRIAVLGGIDLDFVCRSTPEEVYRRSRAMLERSAGQGSFALGTGNSVPDYVPDENYFAMTRAALDQR